MEGGTLPNLGGWVAGIMPEQPGAADGGAQLGLGGGSAKRDEQVRPPLSRVYVKTERGQFSPFE
jgi:hypothetical protein